MYISGVCFYNIEHGTIQVMLCILYLYESIIRLYDFVKVFENITIGVSLVIIL
jgi:hypothetical protein